MTSFAQTPVAQLAQAEADAKAQAKPDASGIDFDSDEPLTGGVCDMHPGCESCQ